MKFAEPLIPGRLVKRYKRFLADVTLDSGEVITATCPNTGSMLGLTEPGSRVWLSTSDSPTRKYKHTWELVETDFGAGPAMVGINTNHPNRVVSEAIAAGLIRELTGYDELKREVKYGASSRIDILLTDKGKAPCYVEIKNVHMMRKPGAAEFPDCVTERGAKHLSELAKMVEAGNRAVMLYFIQIAGARSFSLAGDLDPAYLEAFTAARAAGVEAIAYGCSISADTIAIEGAVPFGDSTAAVPRTAKKRAKK